MSKVMVRLLAVVCMLSILLSGVMAPAAAATWQGKVDAWVLDRAAEGETEFLVFLTTQADLSGAEALSTKLEKGTYVYETLTSTAERTQGALIAELARLGADYQPYWIANMILVRGDLSLVRQMAERADVLHVYANPQVALDAPAQEAMGEVQPEGIEWNIIKVNADDVWNLGYTGQGVVIGGQDTGYDWDHPALVNQYRGWNGAIADHDYNWHDSIHENDPHTAPGNPCGFNSVVPCDDQSHGTHTMGTMVGDDGGANQIGMAPGARWIGCRNMEEGWGKPSTYAECYQWFVAPTRVDGSDPNPAMAPDAINNSWGCPSDEGCTDPNVLLTVVENLVAAGIVTAHSAGNSGSGCSSVDTPAAIYDKSFTVGATNSSDTIASFSSRGPVSVDGSNRPKPDISAPGVSIRSSIPGGGYAGGWSGTSMAGPHVAGEVGLLISAVPSLRGQVAEIENIIEQSALHIAWTGCSSDGVPNNAYGWGRIDALAAVQMTPVLALGKVASSETVLPGEVLTYTLTVSYLNAPTPTTNVVLTDTLPAGTTFVSATEPYTLIGETVQWDFAQLMGTEQVDLVVNVDLAAFGSISNDDYGVQSDQVPLVMGEPVVTEVLKLDFLSLGKSASAGLVFPGELVTYTLAVSNTHDVLSATNLVLTDTLPVGSEFVWATPEYTQVGDVIGWEFSSLAAQESLSVELVVRVGMQASGVLSNADYAVRSDQAADVWGVPVNSLVGKLMFMPLAIRMP